MAKQDLLAHPTIVNTSNIWPQRPPIHDFRSSKELEYPDYILLPEIKVPLQEVIQMSDGILIFSTDVGTMVLEIQQQWEDRETKRKQSRRISRASAKATIRRIGSWHYENMRGYEKRSFKAVELPLDGANIQFPECFVNKEDISFSDGRLLIQDATACKMLDRAVMWIDQGHKILRNQNMLSPLEPRDFPIYKNNHEIDILLTHITHGRWSWITTSPRWVPQIYIPKPGEQLFMANSVPWAVAVNVKKTENFYDARRACFGSVESDPMQALRNFCLRGYSCQSDFGTFKERIRLGGVYCAVELSRNYIYVNMKASDLRRRIQPFIELHLFREKAKEHISLQMTKIEEKNNFHAEDEEEVARLERMKRHHRGYTGCSEFPCEVPRCSNHSCPDHGSIRMKGKAKACEACVKAQEETAEIKARKKALEGVKELHFIQEHQSKPPPGWCCEKEYCSKLCTELNPTCRCAGHCRTTREWARHNPDPEEVPLPSSLDRSLERIPDLDYHYYYLKNERRAPPAQRQEELRALDENISSPSGILYSNRTSMTDPNLQPPDTPARNSGSKRSSTTDPKITESPNTETCDSCTVSSTIDSSETRSSQVSSAYRNRKPESVSTAADSREIGSGLVSSVALNPVPAPVQEDPARRNSWRLFYCAKLFFKNALRRRSSTSAPNAS